MTHHEAARSPKSAADDKTAFRRLVPDDERVTTRPMFGSVAAFANGYMFMGSVRTGVVRAPTGRAAGGAVGGRLAQP